MHWGGDATSASKRDDCVLATPERILPLQDALEVARRVDAGIELLLQRVLQEECSGMLPTD